MKTPPISFARMSTGELFLRTLLNVTAGKFTSGSGASRSDTQLQWRALAANSRWTGNGVLAAATPALKPASIADEVPFEQLLVDAGNQMVEGAGMVAKKDYIFDTEGAKKFISNVALNISDVSRELTLARLDPIFASRDSGIDFTRASADQWDELEVSARTPMEKTIVQSLRTDILSMPTATKLVASLWDRVGADAPSDGKLITFISINGHTYDAEFGCGLFRYKQDMVVQYHDGGLSIHATSDGKVQVRDGDGNQINMKMGDSRKIDHRDQIMVDGKEVSVSAKHVTYLSAEQISQPKIRLNRSESADMEEIIGSQMPLRYALVKDINGKTSIRLAPLGASEIGMVKAGDSLMAVGRLRQAIDKDGKPCIVLDEQSNLFSAVHRGDKRVRRTVMLKFLVAQISWFTGPPPMQYTRDIQEAIGDGHRTEKKKVAASTSSSQAGL